MFWLCLTVAAAPAPFGVRCIDSVTGRGVPLVELTTVNQLRYVSDSQGWVAFDEPGLLGTRVWFTVRSHGYDVPADGFGYHGAAFDTTPGGTGTVKLVRRNVAERLYRITGGGIYADSVKLGQPVPLKQPVLDGLVLGQDSVMNAVYQGRIHWFWGDTNRPAYPLGNFQTPGAVSDLPGHGGLDPDQGVDLTYYVNEHGFAKQACPVPGDGPCWIGGVTVLTDGGRERMFCTFAKVRQDMSTHRWGLAEWNDAKALFEPLFVREGAPPACWLGGQPFGVTEGGVRWLYLSRGYAQVRVRADVADLQEPAKYEAFTCLKPGATAPEQLDRAPDGALRWGWKPATAPLDPAAQAKLLKAGALKPEEALLQLQDVETGKAVQVHNCSIYWNAYRKRYLMIANESWGTSMLGEIWYAEADRPLGPWLYARKVVTHDKYSFYNPKQDPMFDQDGGRLIYFEGTYTATFSGNQFPTPRYDYNQVMYRLDLADPRLVLPVAVYRVGERLLTGPELPVDEPLPEIAYFACDRPAPGLTEVAPAAGRLYALPPDAANPPATTMPLEVDGKAVARVWRSPWRRVPY
ncbi:MAG: hypothetical protein HYU66_18705 [Armatimonadetes bacterium]|nr:hypothetical protein [Armatimonadota bacterium]